MSIIKSLVAFLGSGVVTGVVSLLPPPYGVAIGAALAVVTGFLTWLIPNTPKTP